MAITVVNTGNIWMIDLLRNEWNVFPGLDLWAFKSNTIPTIDSVLADFTEADFDGYARIVLGLTWSLPFIAAGHALTALGPQQFICTGSGTPNDIWGVLVVHHDLNLLLWAERFPSSRPMADAGDRVIYTPSFTGASES